MSSGGGRRLGCVFCGSSLAVRHVFWSVPAPFACKTCFLEFCGQCRGFLWGLTFTLFCGFLGSVVFTVGCGVLLFCVLCVSVGHLVICVFLFLYIFYVRRMGR